MARESRLEIDGNLCHACRKCQALKACKVRAIVHIDPDDSPYLDIRRCLDCRVCIPACPFGAIITRGSTSPVF